MFQTSPSGSRQGNSPATLFCLKMRLMSATFTSMSPETGKSFTRAVTFVHTVSTWRLVSRCSFGVMCPVVSQVSECGHGVAVRCQWEQQHGGGHRIPATGTAAAIHWKDACIITSLMWYSSASCSYLSAAQGINFSFNLLILPEIC